MAVRTYEVPLQASHLRLDADERWAEESQGLLAHLATLPEDQLTDLTIDIGWAVLTLGSDLRLRGPAFSSGQEPPISPEPPTGADETARPLTDDLTPHLAAMVSQARTSALIGAPAEPIRFDEDITVEHDALDADSIYIKRTGWPEDASGWHLGPLTAEPSEHIHLERKPAYEIIRTFPALLDFLALPENYLVGLVGGQVDAVFNPEGTRVMGAGGTPRLEAHPALLDIAAEELGLTKPEAIAYSIYHRDHGYYLVWREEPAAMIAVHPNGELLRLDGLVGPDRFAELWARGDRTPRGYSL
ncbi:immunity protein Imm33 domain-containing protein [Granulicoccus sp. GXG6511]|uniref:immunity protein Imm33 domain-containing protein n=1 Tax=Granulicoccus sp. GXG6511 TaxID=3381351 RepID=UPI003D7E0101